MPLLRILWVVLVVFIPLSRPAWAVSGESEVCGGTSPRGRSKIEIEVRTASQTVHLGGKLELEVLLKNTARRIIYIYGYLDWGVNSNLIMNIKSESTNDPIKREALADAPFPPAVSESDFIKLRQKSLYGLHDSLRLESLGILRTGTYVITVGYISPISELGGFGLPLVVTEDGVFCSRRLSIRVIEPATKHPGNT